MSCVRVCIGKELSFSIEGKADFTIKKDLSQIDSMITAIISGDSCSIGGLSKDFDGCFSFDGEPLGNILNNYRFFEQLRNASGDEGGQSMIKMKHQGDLMKFDFIYETGFYGRFKLKVKVIGDTMQSTKVVLTTTTGRYEGDVVKADNGNMLVKGLGDFYLPFEDAFRNASTFKREEYMVV